MGFKENLADEVRINIEKLPSSYQIVGDALLLKMPKIKKQSDKKKVANSIVKLLPYVKTVCEIKQVSGEFRKPKIKILYGGKTETIHKENGVLYKIDVSKIMFSKGNLSERKRLVERVKPNEIIIDMFAGIGYFSLNLAKFTKAKKIYSIEKNKTSFEYLKENVKLNKIQNIEPMYGDCRKVNLSQKADRIIMGYFPGTDEFLPAAFGFLKDKGIIHCHNIFSKNDLWTKPILMLKKSAKENGFKLGKVLEKKIVKDYAPNVYHVVVDASFSKLNYNI